MSSTLPPSASPPGPDPSTGSSPGNGDGRRRAGLAIAAVATAVLAGAVTVAVTRPAAAPTAGGTAGTAVGTAETSAENGQPAAIANVPGKIYKGTALDGEVTLPEMTLTDTAGKPYQLRDPHGSTLTLLYFGYTHCPDVCPMTMADVALALRRLPAADRAKVRVVMVTSDPARDTPAQMRTWLDAIDPSFVGLTGPIGQITKAAESVGIPIEAPVRAPGGEYEVTHGTQLIAFDAKGAGQALWTAGFAPGDLVHDLPLLLRAAGSAPAGTPTSSAADALVVTDPWVRQPLSQAMTGGYLVVRNNGDQADRLVSVTSDATEEVQTHETVTMNGAAKMRQVDGFAVPAHGELVLKPGGNHLMLMRLTRTLKPGELVRFTLTFQHAGTVTVVAPVRDVAGNGSGHMGGGTGGGMGGMGGMAGAGTPTSPASP